METFGDKLIEIINSSKTQLFLQGEMAQLTYISFEQMTTWVDNQKDDAIPISYPIGYNPDKTTMMSQPYNYSKEDLKGRYAFLGLNKLPIDAIYQLVTITETMLNDLLKTILMEFPKKIPNKKKLDIDQILACDNLDQIKRAIVDTILNEFAYKSPKEYADEFCFYSGVKLLETPVFHQYIELKATRDIHIHNKGIANEIYLNKAGVLARVKSGIYLPVTIQYFLEMYEQCLQLTEVLEKALNDIWPSLIYKNSKKLNIPEDQQEAVEQSISEAKGETE
ncbi:MAG: hypothetical protein A2046_14620 [Bacteroidetes bacterium GWA2_30_7]|nr:MAG: hypothetical protein A2046_14620 [Bacteroidetes bacterium GWA2_30_7]